MSLRNEVNRPASLNFLLILHLRFLRLYYSTYKREECQETPNLKGEQLVPQNNLTATQKVEWALNMVEAMALLHNHEKGLIIHGKFGSRLYG